MKLNTYQNKDPYQLRKTTTDDDKQCRLRFIDCHKSYPLQNLNKKELKEFISFAKKIETLTWKSIKFEDNGLHYKTLTGKSLPPNTNDHIRSESMRVSKKFRIIGYRDDEYFYIVWFDNNHNTC